MNKKTIKSIASFLALCLLSPYVPAFGDANLPVNEVGPISFGTASFLPNNAPQIQTAPSQINPSAIISEDALKKYVLGVGDLIDVHIIVGDNSMTLNYSLLISPGGIVFFPHIGDIKLSGLTIVEAKEKLNANIKKYYAEEFRLSLILKQPKVIKLYITGNAVNPGPFSVYDGTRISEFIKMAGGAAAGGSARKVIIKRKSRNIIVDLSTSLLGGDMEKDIFVQSGDIIEIPHVVDKRVTILGEVSKPGVYEINEGEKLKDLLKISGYMSVNSSIGSVILLKRSKESEQFIEYKLNLYSLFLKNDETQNMELSDGDIITIPSIETYVFIYGEVSKSGRFSYLPGKKLSDYLNLAGGPSAKANLGFVTITRNDGGKSRNLQVNVSDILYRGFSKYDIEIMAGDIISVPTNLFYFADFGSFANTILLGLTLYATVSNSLRK